MESNALTVGFLVTVLSVVLRLLGKKQNDLLVEKAKACEGLRISSWQLVPRELLTFSPLRVYELILAIQVTVRNAYPRLGLPCQNQQSVTFDCKLIDILLFFENCKLLFFTSLLLGLLDSLFTPVMCTSIKQLLQSLDNNNDCCSGFSFATNSCFLPVDTRREEQLKEMECMLMIILDDENTITIFFNSSKNEKLRKDWN